MDTAIKITAIVYIIIAIVIIGSCSISKDSKAPVARKEETKASLYLVTNQIYVQTGDQITLNIPDYQRYDDLKFFVDGKPVKEVESWGANNVKLRLPDLTSIKPKLYAVYNTNDTSNKISLINKDANY